MDSRPSRTPATITTDNAADLGTYADFQKVGTTRISTFTVPPGTAFQTPEGLRAEDEECRVAFDVQGGVYPIRESVFQRSYALAALPSEPPSDPERLDVERLRRAMLRLGYTYVLPSGSQAELLAREYARLNDTAPEGETHEKAVDHRPRGGGIPDPAADG